MSPVPHSRYGFLKSRIGSPRAFRRGVVMQSILQYSVRKLLEVSLCPGRFQSDFSAVIRHPTDRECVDENNLNRRGRS